MATARSAQGGVGGGGGTLSAHALYCRCGRALARSGWPRDWRRRWLERLRETARRLAHRRTPTARSAWAALDILTGHGKATG